MICRRLPAPPLGLPDCVQKPVHRPDGPGTTGPASGRWAPGSVMQTSNFQCGQCGKPIAVEAENLDGQVRCPHCLQVVLARACTPADPAAVPPDPGAALPGSATPPAEALAAPVEPSPVAFTADLFPP